MEDWKEYKLGDLLTIKYGKDHKKLKEGNIPVYGSGGIMRRVNQSIYDGPSIMIPRKGSLNNVLYSDTPFWTVDTMFWSIINDNIVNPLFLYYSLCKKDFASLNVGSAVPSLTVPILNDIDVNVPTFDTQNRIVGILKSLDDKIELNRRINDNLEQQAQALSKAWFVDFEPFKDGKFVNSELGRIPEGWKILCADEIYNINIGKTPPRKESVWFSETEDANIKWISISDLANCGTFVGSSSEYLTPQAINKFNIIVVPSDTVLLSFKLTIGRIAIAKCSLTTNEAIARFYLPNPTYREFTYLTLKNYDYSKLGSTSSIATAVNSKIIKNMKILFPNTKDIEKFHNTVKPIFDTIKSKSDEIDRLCELRDTLLPRLMSGELSINTITE